MHLVKIKLLLIDKIKIDYCTLIIIRVHKIIQIVEF